VFLTLTGRSLRDAPVTQAAGTVAPAGATGSAATGKE